MKRNLFIGILILVLIFAVGCTNTGKVVSGEGSIDIKSTPTASEVYVDGVLKGNTPIVVQASVGSHKIEIKRTGFLAYNSGAYISSPGQIRYINAALIPYRGTIEFISDPAGANVFIRGLNIGRATPTTASRDPGNYEVKLTKEGYMDYTNNKVVVTSGNTTKINVVLVPV